MNDVTVFNNENLGTTLRVIQRDGKDCYIAMDVCAAIGTNTRDVPRILKDDEWFKVDVDSINVQLNAPHGITVVTEPGLYKLLLRSRKAAAEPFVDWVTKEVLPSIKEHGVYMTNNVLQKTLEDPAYIAGICIGLVEAREAQRAAEAKLEKASNVITMQKPKADFYDAIVDTDKLFTMQSVAKMFGIPGQGQRSLFEFLRKKKLLIRTSRTSGTQPYQRYVDMDLFILRLRVIAQGRKTHNQTMVTVKGVEYIRKLLVKDGLLAEGDAACA